MEKQSAQKKINQILKKKKGKRKPTEEHACLLAVIGLLPRGKKQQKSHFQKETASTCSGLHTLHGTDTVISSHAQTHAEALPQHPVLHQRLQIFPHIAQTLHLSTTTTNRHQSPVTTCNNQLVCLPPATNRHPQTRLGNLPVQREDQRPCVVHQRQRDPRHRQQVCAPLAPSTPSQRTGHIPLARFADAERHVLAEKHVDNIPRHLPILKTSTLDGCARFKHPSCRELFFHIARLDAPCCLIS